MKKNVFLIVMIVLTVLTSCSKDDASSTSNSLIVGIWSEKPSIEQFTFIFNSNGSGTFQMKNSTTGHIYETQTFTYIYNATTKVITFTGFSHLSIGYIPYISSTSFSLYEDAAFTNPYGRELFKQ